MKRPVATSRSAAIATGRIPLARALSKLGYCSRSRAVTLIKSGEISVNGKRVTYPWQEVDLVNDHIEVGDQLLSKPSTVVIMLNKPAGYVTTFHDELSRKAVMELVPDNSHLFPVGRLDLDTTGLLLLTNDGELSEKITSPGSKIDKTYLATVSGKLNEHIVEKLLSGIEIAEGITVSADECVIVSAGQSTSLVRMRIHEGKNRQVRKMFEAIGKRVLSLHRSTIGKLELDLPEGKWRKITEQEIGKIFE